MSDSCADIAVDSVPDAPREHVHTPGEDVKDPKSEKRKSPSKKNSKSSKDKKHSSSSAQCSSEPLKSPTGANVFCITGSNIHIGNTINIQHIIEKVSPSSRSKRPQKSAEIKETVQSTEKITEDAIDVVADHVGRNWRKLGKELGFTEGQMDQISATNEKLGMKEVIYVMLLQWMQEKFDKATVGKLCKSLWTCEEYDAAQKLAEYRMESSWI